MPEKDFTEVKLNDDGFINTINGNIVHVTVNNFINNPYTDKKVETTAKNFNTRPYSSDTKEREKKTGPQNPLQDPRNQKLFPF